MLDEYNQNLVLLSHFPKFGPKRLKILLNNFSSPKRAYNANLSQLQKAGIKEGLANEFIIFRKQLDENKIFNTLENEGIKILNINDNNYPPLLKEIYDPPCLLYYKGRIDLKKKYPIAIVGTRKISPYGRLLAEEFSYKLARQGLVIVSGMALGVDSAAHGKAIEAKGKTIAVLGTGIDRASIYPSSNRYLANRIIEQGAVMTEFPIGTPPLKHHFPQRNRIISGLSLGTIVIEAGERSGALITAYSSLEQNREVFAIPGNINSPGSKGPHKLLKQGARLIDSVDDVIEALDLTALNQQNEYKEIIPDSEEEKKILTKIDHEPIHINEVIDLTDLEPSVINSTLTLMELKGMVKNVGGMRYVKCN